MELADILDEGSVIVSTDATGKQQVLKRVAEIAARATGVDVGLIERTLSDREALGSTGLGNGIAIPHGKLAGLGGVVAVFVKLSHSVDFEAVDDQDVDLVMGLLAPVGSGADHLKALAKVARLLRTDEVVTSLRRASTPAEIYQVLTSASAAKAA